MVQTSPSSVDAPEGASPPPPPPAAWPPPGLERLQGDLGTVVSRLFVGGAVFTLPLLAGLTMPQDPWGTGVFGDGWWVLVATSLAGLLVLAAAHVGLFRTLRRWGAVVRKGYGPRTVALVLADDSGDTGFLVQGARSYSLIPSAERRALLSGRLVRMVSLLGAGIWLSSGFLVGVLLAARGVLDEGGLVLFTLAPVAVVAVLALVLRSWENSVLARARRAWHQQPWSEDLAREEIEEWHDTVSTHPGVVGLSTGEEDRRGRGTGLRVGAVLTAAMVTLLVLIAVPVVVTAGVGPVLVAIGVPSFSAISKRAARTEAMAPVRIPVDPAITPLEAGEAMVAITGGVSDPEIGREPPRVHGPVFEGGEVAENPTGVTAQLWARELMPRLETGLDADVIDYLRRKGEHPALAEFSILGRAGSIDEMGALYVSPLPDHIGPRDIMIPKYGNLREAAYAHVGGALTDALDGDLAGAEMRLRELTSAGLLMGREGATLMGNLVGFVIAGVGVDALASLYEATGRPAEARSIQESLDGAERVAAIAHAGSSSRPSIREMPRTVTDSLALRGQRWESFIVLNTVGPCLNLNRAVFGPPEGHDAWMEQARASLVRTESEDDLFRAARQGWFDEGTGPPWMGRIFSAILGAGGTETCAGAVARLSR